MKILFIIFLFSLLIGPIGGLDFGNGINVYIHDIVLGVLLIIGFYKTKKIIKPKLFKPIVIFILIVLVSNLYNGDIVGSLYIIRWALYASLYLLLTQKNWKFDMYKYLLYVGVGFASIGMIQFFFYPDLRNLSYLGWDPHYYRLFSSLLDPNFTGIMLVFTILLGFELRNWLTIMPLIGLLLTYSRSSALAIIAAVSLWGIINKKWISLTVILVIILLFIFLPRIPGDTLDLFRYVSTVSRIGSWQQALSVFFLSPLFGVGFHNISIGVDSSLLYIAATTGILGLTAYIYLVFSMFKLGRKKSLYLMSLTALIIHSIFVNSAFYPWVMIWIWMLTAQTEKESA